MTNKELAELKEKLKKASPREIAHIFQSMGHKDPFKNTLLLPSKVKEEAIKQIELWLRAGLLKAQKDG